MNLEQIHRNRRRRARKSRRATKRSRRFRGSRKLSRRLSRRLSRKQQGGLWTYRIPDEAVVGRTSDEGVQGFKTMEEVREERDAGAV